MSEGLAQASARKPDDYYGNARADLIGRLRRPAGRVLDVGCGRGGAGEALRAAEATELVGIEIDPVAAQDAAAHYDDVRTGAVETVLPELAGPFDTILCYDVLEHLVDPAAVLQGLRELVAADGQGHVSVPNARHLALMRDLVLRGTFGYTESGHRDSTHLRWLTRRDLVDLLTATGWRPVQTEASLVGKSRALDRATAGRMREFLALQWQILALPA